MIKIRTQVVIFLLLWLAMSASYAQQGNIFTNFKKTVARADQYFDAHAYATAIDLYKKVLEKEADNNEVKLKMARAYKKLNNPKEAEKWYREVVGNHTDLAPLDQLYFAQTLMINGKHSEAKDWFIRYSQHQKDIRAVNNLMGIENYSSFFEDSADYVLQNLLINSDRNDFSPVFTDSVLVFLSDRKRASFIQYIDARTQSGFFDVYQSQLGREGSFSDPTPFNKKINSKYHEGPLAFYNNGQKIIFTRSVVQKNQKGERILGLFIAERSRDKKGWENVQPYPFNSEAYSIYHPAITQNGDTLYFASEMPGGYGAGDLYRSVLKDGEWSKPENLGSQINTEGNEQYPYLDGSTLYFSSDGHAGMGGLDIYQVALYENESFEVVNMGYPINSTYDDFGLTWHSTRHMGAFSSNRSDGFGNDDLYSFQYKPTLPSQLVVLQGLVIDKIKKTPVYDANVYVIDEETGDDAVLKVDQEGKFSFRGTVGHSYTILADNEYKSGLLSGKLIHDPQELIEMEIWGFPPYVNIVPEVKDKDTGAALRLASIKLKESGNVMSQTHTDFAGKAIFSGSIGDTYVLEISGRGYESVIKNITIPEENAADTLKITINLEKVKPKLVTVKGLVIDTESQMGISKATVYVIDGNTNETVQVATQKGGDFQFSGQVGSSYRIIAEVEDNREMIMYKVENITEVSPLLIEVKLKKPEGNKNQVALKIDLKDSQSKEGVSFAVVKLFQADTIRLLDYANVDGELWVQLEKGKEYLITSDVLGYKEQTAKVNTIGNLLSDTIKVELLLPELETKMASGQLVAGNKGKKMNNARVYLRNEKTGDEQELQVDDEGMFSFEAKEGDTFSLLAETSEQEGILQELVIEESHFKNPFLLKLYDKERFFFVTVNVADKEKGTELPLTELRLTQNGQPIQFSKTDIGGKGRLKIKAGTDYALNVERTGYHPFVLPLDVSSAIDDSLTVAVLLENVLPQFVTIKGKANLQASGSPAGGAQILIVNQETGESNTFKADVNGRFTFEAKPNEVYDILASYGDSRGIITNLLAEEIDAQAEVVLLIQDLPAIAPLKTVLHKASVQGKNVKDVLAEYAAKMNRKTGFVFDKATGTGESHALVYIVNNTTGEAETLTTDSLGLFQFYGRLGQNFSILADNNAKSGLFPYIQLTDLTDTLQLGILGFPPTLLMQVKVTDQEKQRPLKLVSVSLQEENNLVQQEQTQMDGTVFFRVLAGKFYQIQTSEKEYEEQSILIEIPDTNATDTLEVDVVLTKKKPKYIALEGKVVDEHSGEAEDSVLIYIMHDKTWEVETVQTNVDGLFHFRGIENEKYQIIGEKHFRGTNLVDVFANESIGPVLLKIQSEKPKSVKSSEKYFKIAIKDKKTGLAVSRTQVKVIEKDTIRQITYTDVDGYKLLKINTDTEYFLEASKVGYKTLGQTIRAQMPTSSDTSSIVLELEATEKTQTLVSGITVEGNSLQPIPNAQVYIRNEVTGEEQELRANDAGQFTFEGVVGEVYTILAESSQERGSLNRFMLREPNLSQPIPLKMYPISKPLVVKVRLRDQDSGDVIPLANVSLQYQQTYQQKRLSSFAGEAVFHAYSGKEYVMNIDHPAYQDRQITIDAQKENSDTIDVELMLEKNIPVTLTLYGHVYDAVDNRPLNNANIYIINDHNAETLEFMANEKGDFSFQATVGYTYTILADNPIRSGMISELLVNDPQEKAMPFLKIPTYGMLQPITISASVSDQGSGKRIQGAVVRQYAQNNLIREVRTDELGAATWEEYKNDGYHMTIEKEGYNQKIATLDFGDLASGDTLGLNVLLQATDAKPLIVADSRKIKRAMEDAGDIYIVYNRAGFGQVYLSTKEGLFAFMRKNNNSMLTDGNQMHVFPQAWSEDKNDLSNLYNLLEEKDWIAQDTLIIQNIYYGFDDFNLRRQALTELNNIAAIMKRHPQIFLELKAYTDSRGTENYNLELSRKRAIAALQYLVEQGISPKRIMQTPMGEANFVKDCDNLPCTEADHRLNRRTEMWIKLQE